MSFLDKFKFGKKPFKTADDKAEDVKIEDKKSKPAKKTAKKSSVKSLEQEAKKSEKPKVKTKKEDTKESHRILIRPIISEKATDLTANGQYVFEVFPRATKPEIGKAVKNVYGVTPVKVRIINSAGKEVRFGRDTGKLKNKKKAIVTLRKGDKIEIYEGV
jgi:large subunit ribosomal protein L23